MKFNKQIVVILILASLLVSAVGVSVFLFFENEKSKNISNEIVTIYVAKNDIKKNFLIKSSDIKKVTIAKKYLLNKALLHREIINKYAKINIYKNETFIKEKLQINKFQEKVRILEFKDTSYNISFSLFSNANLSLNVGEYINIISVYPKSLKRDNLKYKVQYVASDIKILGFLEKGKTVPKTFRVVKEKIKVKKAEKKEQYKLVTKYADELVLDVKKQILLNLIKDYNKGKQLWMVKVKAPVKKAMVIEPIIKEVKKTKRTKKYVKRIYPYRLYKAKNTSIKKTATIEYIDDIASTTGKTMLTNNVEKICFSSKKFLIAISKRTYLRVKPSLKARASKVVYRNYIIPYTSELKYWYKVCDGTYVHKREASKISKKEAFDKINKKVKKSLKKVSKKSNTNVKTSSKKVLKKTTANVKTSSTKALKVSNVKAKTISKEVLESTSSKVKESSKK